MGIYRTSVGEARVGTAGRRRVRAVAGRRRPSHGVPFARTCKHSLFQDTTAQVGRRNRNRLQYGAVYGDGSASVDPLHALVVDNSDEVWSVGGLDYLPSEGFGSDVVALDVELCRRGRSRWRSCGSLTAHVNTWLRLVDGRPAPTAACGPQASHKPHHNSRERALRGGRSGRNRDESHRRAICQIAGLDESAAARGGTDSGRARRAHTRRRSRVAGSRTSPRAPGGAGPAGGGRGTPDCGPGPWRGGRRAGAAPAPAAGQVDRG